MPVTAESGVPLPADTCQLTPVVAAGEPVAGRAANVPSMSATTVIQSRRIRNGAPPIESCERLIHGRTNLHATKPRIVIVAYRRCALPTAADLVARIMYHILYQTGDQAGMALSSGRPHSVRQGWILEGSRSWFLSSAAGRTRTPATDDAYPAVNRHRRGELDGYATQFL